MYYEHCRSTCVSRSVLRAHSKSEKTHYTGWPVGEKHHATNITVVLAFKNSSREPPRPLRRLSQFPIVYEQTAHLVLLKVTIVLAIKKLIQGIHSLLVLGLAELVHKLAPIGLVRGLHNDRDEWPLELVSILVAERNGAVGFAAVQLGEHVIKSIKEVFRRHCLSNPIRPIAKHVRLVIHVLGGPLVVNFALAVGLALELAHVGHLREEESGFGRLLLARLKVELALVEFVGAGYEATVQHILFFRMTVSGDVIASCYLLATLAR
mmetsp:Transcript_11259/g.31829  ORF Transcript_11259/g.31829 Transcript_11259/m.31829 type:complete len:265 (-) Transcript_11259:35-829(-)